MSNTFKNSKGAGYEFWKSRYAPCGDGRGRIWKDLTHKRERKTAKKLLRKHDDTDNVYLLKY